MYLGLHIYETTETFSMKCYIPNEGYIGIHCRHCWIGLNSGPGDQGPVETKDLWGPRTQGPNVNYCLI